MLTPTPQLSLQTSSINVVLKEALQSQSVFLANGSRQLMPFGLRERLELACQFDVLLNVFQLWHTDRHCAHWKGHRIVKQLLDGCAPENLLLPESFHRNDA